MAQPFGQAFCDSAINALSHYTYRSVLILLLPAKKVMNNNGVVTQPKIIQHLKANTIKLITKKFKRNL